MDDKPFSRALAACLSVTLPDGKTYGDKFIEALYEQALEGKAFVAGLLSDIVEMKPKKGFLAKIAAFMAEKSRLARMSMAVMFHAVSGNKGCLKLAMEKLFALDLEQDESTNSYEFSQTQEGQARAVA